MQFTAMTARLCGGLVLLALLGCHTYSPYGPYQYGYPPGGSNAPGNYVTPPGGTVPQGTVPPTNSLGQPGKIPEDGTGSPSAPRPSGASTGNKPAFEANRNGGLLPNEKPVPVPGKFDSTAFPGPSSEAPKPKITPAKNSTGSEDAGKAGDGGKNGGLFPGPSPFDGSAANSAGGGNTIQPTGGELKQSPDIEPGKFQVPKAGTPIPKSGQPFNSTTPAGKTTAAPKPNPYDYDKKSYAWLRGTLDFDETTKTWHIIYNLTPESDDKYGGSFTLVDDDKLNKLRTDDVVLIEGKIDPTIRDKRNKPRYRVDHLFGPLVPKSSLSQSTAPREFPAAETTGNGSPVRVGYIGDPR